MREPAEPQDEASRESPSREPAPSRSESRQDLTAAEALILIAAGKPLEHARIRRLRLKGEFTEPVVFRNCTLIQLEFDRLAVQGDLTFVNCNIDRLNTAKPSTVSGNLSINRCTLVKSSLTHLTVQGKTFFSATTFRGKFTLHDCTFVNTVSLWEAELECWADIKLCQFQGTADFRSLSAAQGLVLTKCHFAGDFLFRGATVGKKFQIEGSRFAGLVDVSKAKFHDYAYFESIELEPTARLAFANTVGERLLIRPQQIAGRLASEQSGQHQQAMHEYGFLKKCYQSLHWFAEEDWAYYRFKVNQRLANKPTWQRPWSKVRQFCDWLFLDLGCGYGTNPTRAVWMSVAIVLGFALLYAAQVEQFHNEKLPFPGEATDFGNRVMIGLTTSVAVFTSGMGGIREIAKGWMNAPVMIESILGTLLFGLFIVAFSRKVIR